MLKQIKKQLVASCQALEDEPLHSSFIMSKMALAAKEGGAKGIRANSKEDIEAIKKEVDLPIVGILKRDYEDSEVFITATKKEVDEIASSGCEMIAIDATDRKRPNNNQLVDLVEYIREEYSHLEIMADIATVNDAIEAEKLGFDCISTTLYGYTEETDGKKLYSNDFEFLKAVLDAVKIPVIAEGNVSTPEIASKVLEYGAYSVVVGGAISRPQQITRNFVEAIKK